MLLIRDECWISCAVLYQDLWVAEMRIQNDESIDASHPQAEACGKGALPAAKRKRTISRRLQPAGRDANDP